MFLTFKLSFDVQNMAFFGMVTFLDTFSPNWVNFIPNLLVTLYPCLSLGYLALKEIRLKYKFYL